MELQFYEFPNGLRVLHQYMKTPVAHLGVFISAGTRDEPQGKEGIAHFTEHNLFKGTKKRKAFYVMNRMESVGGDLNAYTSKEETCYYASFLKEHFPRALELFSDIVFNSVFPKKELEKERQVVLDEIDSYRDSPSEQILDDFESMLYKGHPIGGNILGSRNSVKHIQREDLVTFVRNHYHPERILISSAGEIDFDRLLGWIAKQFGRVPGGGTMRTESTPDWNPPFREIVPRKSHQAHCVTGIRAYQAGHPAQYALALLNNLLGGPSMTSRLSMAARERNGLTYHIESHYQVYTDAGHLLIYFGTESSHVPKVLNILFQETDRLCQSKLGLQQLKQAKQQFLGQFAVAWESNAARMLGLGKQALLLNRLDSFESIRAVIDALDAEELLQVAREVFDPNRFSTLIFESRNAKSKKN